MPVSDLSVNGEAVQFSVYMLLQLYSCKGLYHGTLHILLVEPRTECETVVSEKSTLYSF